MKQELIEELLKGTKYEKETWRVASSNGAAMPHVLTNARLNAARVQLLAKALRELQVILKPCDGVCSALSNANKAFKRVNETLAEAGLDKESA